MEWVRRFIVEAEAVDGIDGVEFDAPGINEIGKRADHALPLQLPFIAGAGGEAKQRLAVMSVHDYTQFETEAWRMPLVIFPFHLSDPCTCCGERVFQRSTLRAMSLTLMG